MSPTSGTSLPPSIPSPSHPSRLSQHTRFEFLHHTANFHWLSVLHMVMCTFQCYSLISSHPPHPPRCPQVWLLGFLLLSSIFLLLIVVCVFMLSHFSHVWLFVTLWTVACQVPLSMFPGRNTGVGCHFLLQCIFPTHRSNLSLMFPALAGGFFTTRATWEAPVVIYS